MELIKVGLYDYKRFAERHEMDVDGKLIAVVGPNEAGKSSLLQALGRLEDEDGFSPQERTRLRTKPQTSVWARFVLDDDDRAALEHIPEARNARQFVVTKDVGGVLRGSVEDEVHRDLRPRGRVLGQVRNAMRSRWYGDAQKDGRTQPLFAEAIEILESDDERFGSDELDPLRRLAERLEEDSGLPVRLDRLRERLEKLVEQEAAEHPSSAAARALFNRIPSFVRFEGQHRELHATYNLDEPPNDAVRNFLSLAGTSWKAVKDAAGDPGRLKGIVDDADARLREVFGSWGQSELKVSFQVQERTLHLLVQLAATSDYLAITERSDGLRQFVALRAFLEASDIRDAPILLIDEAETHLHYDGQADLITVLEEQEEASKVIYTTHSADCLPPDLGTGIRIVLPVGTRDEHGRLQDSGKSKIVNWFWTEEIEGLGFSSLLVGMGASALAFAAARKAVIAEGASDAILLPTLLREVLDGKPDFQVAPGLANVSREAVVELDLTASRVAYLVDGDYAGKRRKELLIEAGVPSARIITLGGGRVPVVLEDLLAADVYRTAVNAELARWHKGVELPAEVLTNTGRPLAVEQWCEGAAIAPPGKRAVAHQVLEQRRDHLLVDPKRRNLLRSAHAKLEALLVRPTHEARKR